MEQEEAKEPTDYQNRYMSIFLDKYIGAFRKLNNSKFKVNLNGIIDFVEEEDLSLDTLLSALQAYDIEVRFLGSQSSLSEVKVTCINCDTGDSTAFVYALDNLVMLMRLSSAIGISLMAMLVMKIIAKIVAQHKTIYKALILDLDDTLWPGTLAEDGFETVKHNLKSDQGQPFVRFMWFIRALVKEYGIFVALCSRNNEQEVLCALDKLTEFEFPLKDQIDCVVVNDSDKSANIKKIADEFQLMTSACVFIDDNQINRDSVNENLPDVLVMQWSNHDELMNLIEAGCIFDRGEISIKSRQRKYIMKLMKQDRAENCLLSYQVSIKQDANHNEALRLYRTANQFKFNNNLNFNDAHNSVYFELFRENGQSLGVAAALTYLESAEQIQVVNLAISCRFFGIALEEFILIHLLKLAATKPILCKFIENEVNTKATVLINKYQDLFVEEQDHMLKIVPKPHTLGKLQAATRLREKVHG